MLGIVDVQTATVIAWLRIEQPITVAVVAALEMIGNSNNVVDTGLSIGTTDGRVFIVELLRDRLLLDASVAGAGATAADRTVRVLAKGEDASKLRRERAQGSLVRTGPSTNLFYCCRSS